MPLYFSSFLVSVLETFKKKDDSSEGRAEFSLDEVSVNAHDVVRLFSVDAEFFKENTATY